MDKLREVGIPRISILGQLEQGEANSAWRAGEWWASMEFTSSSISNRVKPPNFGSGGVAGSCGPSVITISCEGALLEAIVAMLRDAPL